MKLAFAFSLIVLNLLIGEAAAWSEDIQQPRLKFRAKGPVCTCASGLSEEEIRKAWEARFAKSADAESAWNGEEHHEFQGEKTGGKK